MAALILAGLTGCQTGNGFSFWKGSSTAPAATTPPATATASTPATPASQATAGPPAGTGYAAAATPSYAAAGSISPSYTSTATAPTGYASTPSYSYPSTTTPAYSATQANPYASTPNPYATTPTSTAPANYGTNPYNASALQPRLLDGSCHGFWVRVAGGRLQWRKHRQLGLAPLVHHWRSDALHNNPVAVRHTNPKLRHTDPDLRHTDPELRHTDPELRHTDPDLRHTDPELRHTDADLRHTDADLRHTDPDLRHTDPDLRHVHRAACVGDSVSRVRQWRISVRQFGQRDDKRRQPEQLWRRPGQRKLRHKRRAWGVYESGAERRADRRRLHGSLRHKRGRLELRDGDLDDALRRELGAAGKRFAVSEQFAGRQCGPQRHAGGDERLFPERQFLRVGGRFHGAGKQCGVSARQHGQRPALCAADFHRLDGAGRLDRSGDGRRRACRLLAAGRQPLLAHFSKRCSGCHGHACVAM